MAVIQQFDDEHVEWLMSRKRGIGGSDASTILGFNKWKSPFELYMDKTSDHVEQINNEAIHWGNILEDDVANEFARVTGKKVRKRNQTFMHPKHKFMIANIDRDVVGEKALLECKTTSAYNAEQWEGDVIPPAYMCQIQHYMAVLDYDKAYIAVLIGGQKFVWKEVQRDDEFIELMIRAEKNFWENHVLERVPPAIDGSFSTTEFVKEMFPEDDGSSVDLPDEANLLIDAIESIKEEVMEKQKLQREYENKLKVMIGEAEKAFTKDYQVTYKTFTQNRIDPKRLREELPDVADEYTNQTKSRRMTIKKTEDTLND